MKSVCFIPIKAHSERVPGKNLRLLNGKKLYKYIFENVKKSNIFDNVFVDTDSQEVADVALSEGFSVIDRIPELAKNTANGNDLLMYHYELYPDYDLYFQTFATAPYLQPETIKKCCEKLSEGKLYDSCFTAVENQGFFWMNGTPINYRPCVLPRSQDMLPLLEETTALYGITKESLIRYHCRIGKTPYIHIVNKFEAVDINTEDDWKIAEFIGKVIYGF